MSRAFELTTGVALVIAMGCGVSNAAAQSGAYPTMAPIGRYLMDRSAEVPLARSAAPASISRDATVLVLGRQGYETAVHGTNGFVCVVDRGFMAAFDWPEFWNPKVRAAACLNAEAARWLLPIEFLRSRMVMAGRSKAEVVSAIKAAYAKGGLPALQSGAMCYMMSKASYLTDQGGHNASHVMFYTAGLEAKDWGSGAAGSPIVSAPYWFFSPTDPSQMQGLQSILVSLVMVPVWSDGTAAAAM